jgi:hypothetical protein
MAFAHGGAGAAGEPSDAQQAEGRRAGRRVSRPGRLVAVFSCSNLQSLAGSADGGGLEGALRRLGIEDGASRPLLPFASGLGSGGRGSGGGLFGTPGRAAPSPGASSSGSDAWDGSNSSSCASPRERGGRHKRTTSCPVDFGGGAAGGPPPLWLRRGRGRGPSTLEVPDASLGVIHATGL